MTTGKRRSKRTARKLKPRYPRGVKLHVVDSDDGDHSAKPTPVNTNHDLVAKNTDGHNGAVKSSQCHKNKKKCQDNHWTEEDMEHAIEDVEDNCFSIRGAAKKWGIPMSSLSYWLAGLTTTRIRGPPTILSLEEELEVVQWCKDLAQLGRGLEVINLKSHVAHICQTRPNPFKNGLPGRSWWVGFRKRHPDLTIRTAEGLDRDRAVMLRPSIVADFYDNLSTLYNSNHYEPTHIWNCDETGVQAGRNCGMKVIAKLGSRSVPQVLSKSREWITVLCCINAAGNKIPGFYLFKAKRKLKNYIANCEPGACMAAQEHAWMTKELFLNWLHHFARSVPGGASPTNRHLLVFDGHGSHIAFATIQEARSLGIDLLTLPAHTSHRLQPLDVSVFSPFKGYFKSERSKWMAKHPHIEIRRTELAELASKAFKLALVPDNIIAGFRRTGIWPLNRDALCNDMKPSDAFNVEDEHDVANDIANYAAGIESILRIAGYEGDAIEKCVAEMIQKKDHPNANTSSTVDNVMTQQQEHPNANTSSAADDVMAQQQDNPNANTSSVADDVMTQQQDNPNANTSSAADDVFSPTHISQTQFENDLHDEMSLPTQFDPPAWIKEGAKELGVQIEFQNEDISLSIPSPPPMPRDEVVHYYAETKNWETSDLEPNEDEDGYTEHNVDAFKTPVAFETEDEQMLCSQGSLRSFLKLPIERVAKRSIPSDNSTLRLGRKSQILTSNEYITMQEQQEARKGELKELKERKQKQLEEKKKNQIELRKRKDEQKLERQIIKKRKQEEKVQQQKERELKKKEKLDCRKGKLGKGNNGPTNIGEGSSLLTSLEHHQIASDIFNNISHVYPTLDNQQLGYGTISESNANRADQHSTPSTPLPEHHQILRDMYNILSPHYAALQNNQATSSQSPPHSPIKQFQIGRLLDENMFGHLIPITPQVDSASPRKDKTNSTEEDPTNDSTEEGPDAFPGFMVN